MAEALLGRRGELAEIERFFDSGVARALLIEGEPGIGKTSLWREGVRMSRERDRTVLVARPGSAEVRLAFAGLRDLLDGVLDVVASELPAPQRQALEVALLLEQPEGFEPEPRAVAFASLTAFRLLARSRPLTIAIDDLQWLDRPTSRALEFVLRRLDEEPVLVLASVRTERTAAATAGLEGALPGGQLIRLPLGPLSLGALHELMRAAAGISLSRPALVRLLETTGGNPFFALQIGLLLEGRVEGLSAELPLPSSLRDLVRRRLAGLPKRSRSPLAAAAALTRPTVGAVRAASSEPGRVTDDLDQAVAARIVELDGDAIIFSHPLLASVLYGELRPGQRRELHRRLAAVVGGLEERAHHLALAADEPDAGVAAALDEAAGLARARGAPEAAAELLDLAHRITPPDHAADARRRLLRAAEYHLEAGDTALARALFERVVAESLPGPARAHTLARLGWLRSGWGDDPHTAVPLFEQALRDAGDDLAAEAAAREGLTWAYAHLGERLLAAQHARAGVAAAERLGDPHWLVLMLMALAVNDGRLGLTSARQAITRAVALEDAVADRRAIDSPAWVHALFLASEGNLEAALARIRPLHERAVASADESSLPNLLEHLSLLELRAGEWDAAARHAREGYDAAVRTDQQVQRLKLHAVQALLDAYAGRAADARAGAAEGVAAAEIARLSTFRASNLWALGTLELSLGRAAEAHQYLVEVVAAADPGGLLEHPWFRFFGDAAEAMVELGEVGEAERLVGRLEHQARVLDAAWARAFSARCRGLVAARSGDAGGARTAFAEALAFHEDLSEPFELARTLLALGTVQRRSRAKRQARETLERAEQIFTRLGAELWAERARSELGRVGGRRAIREGLSETERRVAELVAEGKSNKQVAQVLQLSPGTVAWNLSKVYRKLDLRSRGELAARYGRDLTLPP